MTLWPLYRLLTRAAGPAITLYLGRRRRRGREHPTRHPERQGIASVARPPGPLVWLHGASVGESLALLPLVDRLLAENAALAVLVTSGTVASATVLADRRPPRTLPPFVPIDRPASVARFLDHWRPNLAVWIESELWPNLVLETRRRRIPMALVNARMSAGSFRSWGRIPSSAARLLGCFGLVLAQDEIQAARLRQLGARGTVSVGDLKYAGGPPPDSAAAGAVLAARLAGRQVWLAASTHPGEERIAADAHRLLRRRYPRLLTIVAPRHPARADAIAEELAQGAAPLRVARRSRDEPVEETTEIYLADTLGELGMLYRLCPIALVGGSLTPVGGHNLLEAAWLDCAILHGPHTFKTAAVANALDTADAALPVSDAATVAAALAALLDDPDRLHRMTAAARTIAESQTQILEAVLERLRPLLALASRPEEAACAPPASGTAKA